MINIMNEYLLFTNKCFHKYLKHIFNNKYDKKIADEFINAYINVRYSNYIDENSKKLSIQKKVDYVIDCTSKRLQDEYGVDKIEIIKNISRFSHYFFSLDQLYLLEAQKSVIQKIDVERTNLFGEDKEFAGKFSSMVRNDIKLRKEFLDNFESNTFYLNFSKLSKTDYMVTLENKIVFPELYSLTAIKKAGERDSINEDMIAIMYLQVVSLIIKDLISCNFEKNYYVKFPITLFDKKAKINRLFNIVDNVFIQDRIRIVITFECFSKYGSYVREYMRNGFFFAIILDDTFDYCSENIQYLELFEKIFIDFNKYYYKDMKKSVKIKDRIVSIDEVK